MDRVYSTDKQFYFEIIQKNELLRIKYFLNYAGENEPENFVAICGTNASVFDDLELAKQEGIRMLTKYEQHPELFKG